MPDTIDIVTLIILTVNFVLLFIFMKKESREKNTSLWKVYKSYFGLHERDESDGQKKISLIPYKVKTVCGEYISFFWYLFIIFMAFNAKQGLLIGAGTKNLESVIHGILPQIIVFSILFCFICCTTKIMDGRRVSVNWVIKCLLSSPFYLIIFAGFIMTAGASVKVLTAAVVMAAIIGLFAVAYLICAIIMFSQRRKNGITGTVWQQEQDKNQA